MSELTATLAELETALRAIREDGGADWVAERRARADAHPEEVRADLRRVLSGMGSITDLPLDRELVRRVRRLATGEEPRSGPEEMVPVRPGGPIRP
jgi:hypothetical protein